MSDNDGGSGDVLSYDGEFSRSIVRLLGSLPEDCKIEYNNFLDVLEKYPLSFAFGEGDHLAKVLWANAGPGVEAILNIAGTLVHALGVATGKGETGIQVLDAAGEAAAAAVKGGGRH